MQGAVYESKDPKSAFFPVELSPVYVGLPVDAAHEYSENSRCELVPLKRHFAVVDISRKHTFTVVTNEYELVTNEEAYEMAREVMEKVFHVTTMEDMECFNVIMPSTRSFCHIDLVHKSAGFSPWEKDEWTAFIRITNSYNKTRRLKFELGFCRWICMNGMIFGATSVEYSYAHTRGEKECVKRFVENIGDIRKMEVLLTEKLHNLRRYHVPENLMLPVMCRAFNIKVNESVYKKERRVEELVELREHAKRLTEEYFMSYN